MIRYIKLMAIVFTIVFLYLCTRNNSNPVVNSGGSGTETVGGILVDTTGAPVAGAIVRIDSIDSQSTSIFYDTTDANGEYYIDSIKAGSYTLFGYLPPDSILVINIDTIRYINAKDTLFLGIDTMYTPSGITGRVLLEGEGRAGVDIYIPGTSFGAKSDDSGYYTMIYVLPGVYSVNYEHSGYQAETDSGVEVFKGLITQLGVKNLVIDTTISPPPPKNVTVSYDTLNGIARITWDSVTVADLNKYKVFRSDSGIGPFAVGYSDSTVYYHAVFDTVIDTILDTTEYPRKYQIKSVDNLSNESDTYSNLAEITALSPTVVKTFFTFKRVDQNIRTYQEVSIVAQYKNHKRKNNIIRWFADDPMVVVKSDTIDAQQGIDTLIYTWSDSGLHTVCIEAVDDGGSVWRDSVEVVTVMKPDVWYSMTPLNENRRYHSTAVVGNKLYVIGGAIDFFNGVSTDPKAINSVECFSFSDSTWTIISPMPTARFTATASVVDNKIYVIGGMTAEQTYYNTVEIYDTESNQWLSADTMPLAKFGHASTVINDSIYVFGGYSDSSNGPDIVNSIQVYDPATKGWSQKSNMITPRAYHQVVLRGDRVYILGGMKELDALKSVEIYNPIDNTIIPGKDMLYGRMYFGAALLRNNIYVFGGFVSYMSPDILDNSEAYNPVNDMWIVRKSLPTPRQAFGNITNKGVHYIIGGADRGAAPIGQLKTVLQYYP